MKVLHLAALSDGSKNIGVLRQLQYEVCAAKELGLQWDVHLWSSDKVEGFDFNRQYPSGVNTRISRRFFLLKEIIKTSFEYDLILVRYAPADPFLPFMRLFRLGPAKILFVHHTKETTAFRSMFPGWRGIVLSLLEGSFGSLSIRQADGLVGVTKDILHFELARSRRSSDFCFSYPNGIDYEMVPAACDRRSGKIKIVFIASTFFTWHGLSEVLDGLSRFPLNNDIELHLVGRLLDSDLRSIEFLGIQNVVHCHGYLDSSELKSLLAFADVGLASFGLGESGLTEACTLKVREYLASGVSVYSGHRDAGIPEGFPFYFKGPVQMDSIYAFAWKSREVSRGDVRDASMPFIGKKALVQKLASELFEVYQE